MRTRLIAAVAMAVLCVASEARAGEDEAEARQHYQVASDAYAAGRRAEALAGHDNAIANYKVAVEEYIKSYTAQAQPGTLYALGQAYRAMGDLEHALHSYRQYLIDAPANGRWRDSANKQISEIEEALNRKLTVQQSPPRGVPARPDEMALLPPAVPREPDAKPRRSWVRDPVVWATLGVGVAGLAVGGSLLGLASHQGDLAASASTLPEFDSHHASDLSFQKAGWSVLGMGAAALVVGGIVIAVDHSKKRK